MEATHGDGRHIRYRRESVTQLFGEERKGVTLSYTLFYVPDVVFVSLEV